MANILDYLEWRGDLPLERVPLCEVDRLILCRLAYMPFGGVVPEDASRPAVALGDAAERLLRLTGKSGDGRSLYMKDDKQLLSWLIKSRRFSGMRLTNYVNIFEEQNQEQFSATTVLLPDGSVFLTFRGTDGTLVGWKEDFNMGFCDKVPSQEDAVIYLQQAAYRFSGPIRLGGHSKGGNLAVYAAAFCGRDVQERVLEVRNMDGPGFSEDIVGKGEFQNIMDRTHTILPQSSVVGMLLQHSEDFSVVRSDRMGLFQHDLYSWQVIRSSFATVSSRTNSSVYLDAAFKDWLSHMSDEQRERFVDGVYTIFAASGCRTLKELQEGRNAFAVAKALASLDDATRHDIQEAFSLLSRSLRSSLPVLLDGLRIGPLQLKF